MEFNQKVIDDLNLFKTELKFKEDLKTFYPGAISDIQRMKLQILVNSVADKILEGGTENFLKEFVLDKFREIQEKALEYDTEDRERICYYLEKIMDICEIESSDGVLEEFVF